MKIGIVCYPTYGGSGALATDLGQCLAERENCVHVISYEMPFRLTGGMSERMFFHEVTMTDYPVMTHPYYSLNLSVKIMQIAQEVGLDLLHVHYAVPHAVSAHLAREMLSPIPLPLITTLHGTDITLVGNAPAYKPIVQFSLNQSDRITAVSNWLRQQTEDHFTPDKPIQVIHNFINHERFKPQSARPECRRRFAEDDEKIIMHISNFRPVKRVGDVVEVFARIAKKMPARLVMIGDGPDREAASIVARCNSIGDRVSFLGKQTEIEKLLPHADLFLFPSDHESFGLAPAEAMACEVPVVASQSGGLCEVITEGETGFLRPIGDINGMTEISLQLLRDGDLHRRIAKAARQDIIDRFSPTRIVDQYVALYREVLNEAGLPYAAVCEPEKH